MVTKKDAAKKTTKKPRVKTLKLQRETIKELSGPEKKKVGGAGTNSGGFSMTFKKGF